MRTEYLLGARCWAYTVNRGCVVRSVPSSETDEQETDQYIGTHIFTHRETFLSSKVTPENGRLKTWMTGDKSILFFFLLNLQGKMCLFIFFTVCGVLLCQLNIFILHILPSCVSSIHSLARGPFLACLGVWPPSRGLCAGPQVNLSPCVTLLAD